MVDDAYFDNAWRAFFQCRQLWNLILPNLDLLKLEEIRKNSRVYISLTSVLIESTARTSASVILVRNSFWKTSMLACRT